MKKKREGIPIISATVTAEKIDAIKTVFPESLAEGKVDFEKLRESLGDFVDDRPDRFTFSWAGKRNAIRISQNPSRAALVPVEKESLDFERTENVFIEGENLEVLKLLYKSYFGRVKMIYIDPPYNTGNDLIYPDSFADPLDTYLKITGQKDSTGNLLTSNPETAGRYHSNWLSMMYPRLLLARQLLREGGVIFVSIDDHEVHNLRMLMNEIFGEENFVATFIWQKMDSPSRNDAERATTDFHDYIVLYARNKKVAKLRQKAKPEILRAYPSRLEDGRLARIRQLRKNGKGARRQDRPTMWYPIIDPDGKEIWPIAPEGWEGRWVLSPDTWEKRVAAGLAKWVKRKSGWTPYYIEIAPTEPMVPWSTLWIDVDQNRQSKAKFTALMGSSIEFDNPKPCNLIMNMLRMATEPDDLVLDFFAGSCSTADAVMQLNREDGGNRRFIVVQLPLSQPVLVRTEGGREIRTIADVGRERIRRVIENLKKKREGELDLEDRDPPEDLGCRVFRLAESNVRSWTDSEEKDAVALARQINLFNDPLVPGWKPKDLIWEVALKEGYGLNARIEAIQDTRRGKGGKSTKPVGGKENRLYRVADPDKGQSFIICLDGKVELKSLGQLNLKREDVFICRDCALDDEIASNLAVQCSLKTI